MRSLFPKKIPEVIFILLLFGLLWSRAVLSIVTAMTALYAICVMIQKKEVNFRDPLLIWSFCPILIWLLGAWQQPFQSFNYDYLLTLLAYPSFILFLKSSNAKERSSWTKYWVLAALISLIYPIIYFIKNYSTVIQAYGTGQTLPSFMDNDHIRYSIFLCSAILLLIFRNIFKPIYQKIILALVFAFVLFLSVRTGWAILFVFFLLIPVYFFLDTKQNVSGKKVLLIGILLTIGAVGYFIFPTIPKKIGYTLWEWKQYKEDTFNINLSDGTRRHINEAAWIAIHKKNQSNIGWSGITASLTESFQERFPDEKLEFGWPFNQWLFWWMGAGCIGMILFSIWICYPLYWGWKYKNPGLIFWTSACMISCLVETNLNYQYGVFLQLWPLALLWHQPATSINDNS